MASRNSLLSQRSLLSFVFSFFDLTFFSTSVETSTQSERQRASHSVNQPWVAATQKKKKPASKVMGECCRWIKWIKDRHATFIWNGAVPSFYFSSMKTTNNINDRFYLLAFLLLSVMLEIFLQSSCELSDGKLWDALNQMDLLLLDMDTLCHSWVEMSWVFNVDCTQSMIDFLLLINEHCTVLHPLKMTFKERKIQINTFIL